MAVTRDADWWPRLDAAFQGALELPEGERAGYLDRVCGVDDGLRAEVEAMLTADAPEHALEIERLVNDAEAASLDPDPFIGMRLGPWLVVDVLGHGGMGTVYLAERDDGQYQQRVALKLVRGPARDGPLRFTAESHILARLSHPSIARLIDAGHTPEGSAYLVMEYVDGSPITAHADAHRLTVDDRLRLFAVVCDATQHAHQALVVHRDLKPSNILVSRAGEVKLLDFGIAKLLEPDHPLADPTRSGLRALTPAYAAPEQLRGEPVSAATDVFVLGAVLFELLTGQRPGGPDAAMSASRDVPLTAPPSVVVRRQLAMVHGGAGTPSALAATRQTSPARLVRRLSGDVDCVVLKAMQPEPERRYGSAGQLADDLRRLLDGRPVLAQPDTRGYRLRRFVGRHRFGVAMVAALATLVVAFAIVAALQARAVAIERDRARVEAARAGRVAVLVTGLFKLAEPAAGRGSTIAARELLDRGSQRIAVELGDDPETQAALFNALARVYGNLGLHDDAIQVLERALGRGRAENGDGTLARAETLHLLGERHASKSDHATAERRFREALSLRRQLHAPGTDVAATLEGLGQTLNGVGRFADARAMFEDAVAIRRSEPGGPTEELMSGLHELGTLVHVAGDEARAERLLRESVAVGERIAGPSRVKITSLLHHAELVNRFDHAPAQAEPLLRRALAMARAIHPGDHEDTALCLGTLAENLGSLRKLPEAESVARAAAAMWLRLRGPGHEETQLARQFLAFVLITAGKLEEAERILKGSLGDARSFLGDGNPTTILSARRLATLLEQQDRFAEALAVRRDELTRTVKARGDGDVFVAIGLNLLGQHGLKSGRLALAEENFVKALEVRQKLHPAGHWRIDEARGMVGVARLRARRYGAAEADLLAAYDGLQVHRGPDAAETKAVKAHLVDLYKRWDRPERARQYR